MSVLSALTPHGVFDYFEALCSVPHGSGNTKIISDLCVRFAKELGLAYRQDAANNVIIWKGGSAGYEDAEPILLQGHMDMVAVKTADCPKDLAKEGLDLATDGEWIWAEQTSLGGDDCIAVAMILAILADDSLPHPPIEAIFTVDEETGMDGAIALDCSDLKSKKMLNLDSEEEGVFTVSCAGGVRTDCILPGTQQPLHGEVGYRITLSGLLGGHSGVEIDKGRGCANQLMNRVLYAATGQFPGLRVQDIRGGQFDNVICPLCHALVAVPAAESVAFSQFITNFAAVLKDEYAGCDAGITLTSQSEPVSSALSVEDTMHLLRTLVALPQGVESMSSDFPGLVQTSCNLGVMGMEEDGFHFCISVRSCIESQKHMLAQRIHAIIDLAGGIISDHSDYPSWQYVRHSAFREMVLQAYHDLTGKDGVISATHGGLECGIFVNKVPGLDVISIGPVLQDIHSPSERLNVPSTVRLYQLVCEVLKRSK